MSKESFVKIREEVAQITVKYNPPFDPNNIIINRNHVLKIKKDGVDDIDNGSKCLVDNKNWSMSYYDEVAGYLKENSNDIEDLAVVEDNKEKDIPEADDILKRASKTIKEITALKFSTEKRWWNRINQYVIVKIFKEEDCRSILQRHFGTKLAFTSFITAICVEDFEALYQILDDMGITNRVTPPILINELYELCKASNKFLTFENARLFYREIDEKNNENNNESNNKARTTSSGGQRPISKKTKTLKFKDVSKETLLSLPDRMKVFLVGQNEPIDKLTEAIQRASVGLKDPLKPIGSFLFAGSTGIGKTLTSKVLADTLINSKDNLVTIDCSEYSADHEYSKLIGSPNGYIGHENGGFLTNAINKHPFSVVVFDEVEKASNKVHELLLQILEEGRLTDGQGKQVSFKDTIIILTSNVGVEEIDNIKKTIGFGDVAKMTEEKKNSALEEALKKKFKPEFLNRIDNIIHFRTLTKEDYMKIIDIELYKLNDNLQTNDTEYKNVILDFDSKVKKHIYTKGIDENYGARPLKRCIEKDIATPLALKLLRGDVSSTGKVTVSLDNNCVIFSTEPVIDEPPFYLEKNYIVAGQEI
jgi:ATP-dependent Clp protease ATP-binding subunit ClpA